VRIELFISIHARAQIGRLARHHGRTITKMIEDLAEAAEHAIVDQLPSQQHKAYYDGHLLQPAAAPVSGKRQHHENTYRTRRAERLPGNYLAAPDHGRKRA
jgi:hypothetical protein